MLRRPRAHCLPALPVQAVRDEILNIMHRNKIKEVKGTWMEEWHQKLHNVRAYTARVCARVRARLHRRRCRQQGWAAAAGSRRHKGRCK